MKTKNNQIIALMIGGMLLLGMNCGCVFASVETQVPEHSVRPACHGHAAAPGESSAPAQNDCCGKCYIQQAAVIESSRLLSAGAVSGYWLYDPFIAFDVALHGRGDEAILIPIVRRDLLYQQLAGAHALPRSPPVIF